LDKKLFQILILTIMAKYSRKSQKTVGSAMRRRKKGTLRSGRSGKKVTSRKQAIAIGLSEAREKGAKVPAPKKKTARKTATKKKAAKKRSASKKSASRKTGRKKKSTSR
jgi:topoisomerase IA-like protein